MGCSREMVTLTKGANTESPGMKLRAPVMRSWGLEYRSQRPYNKQEQTTLYSPKGSDALFWTLSTTGTRTDTYLCTLRHIFI